METSERIELSTFQIITLAALSLSYEALLDTVKTYLLLRKTEGGLEPPASRRCTA